MNVNLDDYGLPLDVLDHLDEWEVRSVRPGGSLFIKNVVTGAQKAFLHRNWRDNDPRLENPDDQEPR